MTDKIIINSAQLALTTKCGTYQDTFNRAVYRTKRKIARNDWLKVASSADNSFCNSYTDRMESENEKREERGGVGGGAISYP